MPGRAGRIGRQWLQDGMQRGMAQVLRQAPVAVETRVVREYGGTPLGGLGGEDDAEAPR